ncbi:MAG: hypothetical protein ABUS76_00365 [Candidatus Shikimatogenerans sp. Ttur]|uniref:DNA polymerase III alpha subunit finger domain-containing protein n=1 Tax=Candidatus Shikimatogenerans sp. Ttur TaxID=3158569 RepID=A0AAU7ZYA2_9FLAO
MKKTLYDINNINLLKNILLNDKKIFKLFQKGNTIGVFQFESYGLRQYLIKLKPKKINDLIALNALYRPGPIKNINKYINRKYNKNKIVYDIPIMKKYLKETYGIIIYQEQIMILFNKIASFSKKDTDLLRQSIGKKNNILLKKIKKKFIKGGIKNNYKKYILYKI